VAVTYLIKFQVSPAQHDRFLMLLNDVLDAMRHEPTFHEAILHRDPASEYHFMLYETWESHQEYSMFSSTENTGAVGTTRYQRCSYGSAIFPSGSQCALIANSPS
jgi:quinol monooxygenase YgiN